MAMAINPKAQTRTTRTSTIKAITINTIINKVIIKTTTSIKGKTAIMTNLDITTPTPVIHTNKTVDTMKVTSSKAIKTSTTMSSTMIKGRQLLVSTPNMVKVAMEQSRSVVATIPRKTLRLSATLP